MGTYNRKNRIWKNVFIIATVFFMVLSLLLGSIVFLNWDYISFKALMTQGYIKTDILDDLILEKVGVESNGNIMRYFDNLSIAAVTELIRETGKDYYTYQYNPSQFETYTVNREEKAAKSHIKELTPDTVYMLLTNFSEDTLEFFKNSIPEIKNYRNLVLDLRDNNGGDISVILDIADYFLDKNTIMLKETRKFRTAAIRAKIPKELSYDNLVILQNGNTASAAEQLITVLSYSLEDAVTVGVPTYGKYVGQTRIGLLRGFYVKATTLEWTAPDGILLDENGIAPDYTYEDNDIIDFVLENIL